MIVEPVLMAPLRREWEQIKDEVRKMKDEESRGKGAGIRKKISEKLRGFADKITAIKVLDPACGSGNFLYVALRLLLDLQNEVISFSDEMGAGRFFVSVTPAQLYGIEINEYAYELAQMTIQIGYIQWLRDNGYGQPAEPILRQVKNILHMDAVLAYDEKGKPVEPGWPSVDVIVGNPPFLGGKRMRSELGDEYVDRLFELYDGRVPHEADLVCYWFEKAREMIEDGKVKRAGLLATQSIRAGASRKILERIKSTGDIFYAQSDRPWILDGAAVRVSMVGFDSGDEKIRHLNESKDDPANKALANAKLISNINPNLTYQADITLAKRLAENINICFQGPVKVGSFDIENVFAQDMLKASNPNGKPNSDVIKPWMNASDITGHPRNMWIIDFGDMEIGEAAYYEMPFEHVKKNIKPLRDKNNDRQRKTYWWRLGRSGSDLRNAKRDKTRLIVTPRVAKHRIFIWANAALVPDSRLFAFARDDDYFFGVLHSRIHQVWSLATSSRHGKGNDPTYNNTTCFETFPFPWAPGKEPKDDPRVQAIGQAAKELVEQRDRWLKADLTPGPSPKGRGEQRTLTNLYNARPTWLELAHKKLDEALFAAYGWKSDLSDEEILEKLLALNLERSKANK